jgi:hypothetical protein
MQRRQMDPLILIYVGIGGLCAGLNYVTMGQKIRHFVHSVSHVR